MHKLHTNWRNIHHFPVMENTNLSHCRLYWEPNGNEKYKTTNLPSVSHHHFHFFFCWIKSLFCLFDKMCKLKVGNIFKLQVIDNIFTGQKHFKQLLMSPHHWAACEKWCYMFKLYLVKICGWTFTITLPCTLFFIVFTLLNLCLSGPPPLPHWDCHLIFTCSDESSVSRPSPQRFTVAPPPPFCWVHLHDKPRVCWGNSAWRDLNTFAANFFWSSSRKMVSEFALRSYCP